MKEVVVAVDGTAGSIEAARVAACFADAMDSKLTLLYVYLPEDFEPRDAAADKVFEALASALGDPDPKPNQEVLVGDPADEIINYLSDRQDVLAVVGRRGQSKIQSLLLGSVSDKVVRHTRTPVTVVG